MHGDVINDRESWSHDLCLLFYVKCVRILKRLYVQSDKKKNDHHQKSNNF